MAAEPADETRYDLGIAWEWEYDAPFVALLASTCRTLGLNFIEINPQNLDALWRTLNEGGAKINAFLDRASDSNPGFIPLARWAETHAGEMFNPLDAAANACNKASMLRLVTRAGLKTPRTLLLPPFETCPDLPDLDLEPLGAFFTVKPAHGGGSQGVMLNACTRDDIQLTRQTFPADTYLLQTTIIPVELEKQTAWFRILYCCGDSFPCWWHPQTHLYAPVSPDDEKKFGLKPLRSMAAALASICKLELFSTEIALTADGSFVVVDYINDPVDLRLKSQAADGVPDEIIRQIAEALARHATGCTNFTHADHLTLNVFE
jgi:hypothetical protein